MIPASLIKPLAQLDNAIKAIDKTMEQMDGKRPRRLARKTNKKAAGATRV